MRFGIGMGFGTVLFVVLLVTVLAPLVIGVGVAALLVVAAAAAIGAITGHHLRVPASALSGLGWAAFAVIPGGLFVAFFGHTDPALVEVGLYATLAAVPTSTLLIAAGTFARS
jgi:hypothetical protein